MTIEERAHRYEHNDPECEIPRCSCCPALIGVIRAAIWERDMVWAKAVKASGLMLSPDSDNDTWRPLRVLLMEAK